MLHPDPLHPLRPFLKNYVWEHGHIGTRYLNCATGEISFDDGKNPASQQKNTSTSR